ncbi:MAG: helix-turn-helix domain-containing protein [Bosea sp.]|nr:helix-turn-helix domain-containing protein [Bosea sp. (in: a-proteobacteria)]
MGQVYNHLSGEERNFIHRHLNEGRSCRWIAGHLGRSGPTISREIKRSSGTAQGYDASSAASSCRARRRRMTRTATPGPTPPASHSACSPRFGSANRTSSAARKASTDFPFLRNFHAI